MARTDQPHKLTFDDFVAKASDMSNPANLKHFSTDYTKPESRAAWNGSKSKIPLWCTVHDEFYVQQGANHMNGQGCPKCGVELRTNKKRKKDPFDALREKHNGRYDYSEAVYENSHSMLRIICPEHGPFVQKANAHLRGNNCPKCWKEHRKVLGSARTQTYRDMFAERSTQLHEGRYEVVKTPTNSHDMAVMRCEKHGDFAQKAYSHLNGNGCPSCGVHFSGPQNQITDLVTSFGVRVERENKTVLGGLHIDIWAPDQKIGIEYHGSVWHTEERAGNKHREKWERADRAGIRLLQIFDFEWQDRRYAVEERLKALFGVTETTGARTLTLRPATHAEACAFFDEVHTQGRGSNPEVAYGLWMGERLMACMSFTTQRRFGRSLEKKLDPGTWELLRYASRGRVQGGFGRLLKAFVKEHAPQEILSYCDLRWGNGEVYRGAGFQMSHITRPDYWYFKNGSLLFVPRQTVGREARSCPTGLKEGPWAEANGYKRVRGVGSQCWVWRAPTP